MYGINNCGTSENEKVVESVSAIFRAARFMYEYEIVFSWRNYALLNEDTQLNTEELG